MRKTAFSVFVLLLALSGFSLMVQAQNSAKVVIDAYPNTAMVEQGTTLVLVCRVVGVPFTTVLSYQWTCPGGSCDAGAVDPEWAAKVQQDNILVVNMRNDRDTGGYTCAVMGNSTTLVPVTHSVNVTNGLSFLNEDGGLKVFFPRNSFVTNSTLTTTNTPRPDGGNGHIACYGGDPNAAQVTWHDSSGGPLAVCLGGPPNPQPIPCGGCGPVCDGNGAVGLDPPQQGHTDIHMFTGDVNYVNQDLQCRVNGGQSTFIGVYLKMGGASTLSAPSMVMTSGATTTTTLRVSWSQVSGATGYYVSYQRQNLGTPPVVTPQYERIVGGANTSVTLSGLEPGTTYRIRVWSRDRTSVSSAAGEMNVTTVESAPSAPRMLTVTATPSGSTVELNWLPPLHPNGAIRYVIEYEPAITLGFTMIEGGTDLYFNLTLPEDFLTYNVRVVAVNTQGSRSVESNTVSVFPGRNRAVIDAYPSTTMVEQGTTLVLVCRVVGVPSTTVLSYQWTCPGDSCDAGAVDPEWAAKVQQGNILVVNARNGNDTGDYTCTVMNSTTQLASVTHSVNVTNGLSFLNEDGGLKVFFPKNSFVTNTTLTNTDSPRDANPSDSTGRDHIACYGGDPQAAQVTWHNSGGGALGVCSNGSNDVPCASCGGICDSNSAVGVDPSLNGRTSIHLFTDDSRYVNQDLQCRVNGGQSALIGVYLMNEVNTALQPPSSITKGATTNTTVSVSWSLGSGATGYYLSYQRQDLGAPPVVTPQYERIVGGATNVTLSDLQPGTTYTIRVWSTDGTSVSSEAREMNMTTMESAPSAPRALTVTGTLSGSTVELNWLPPLHPNGAIRYEIKYELAMPPGDTMAENGTDLYFNLTLPEEFLTYNVRVVAVNTQGSRSGESNTVSVCPGRNRQDIDSPSNVIVKATSCNSAKVTWIAPEPRVCDGMISGYIVRYRLNTSNGEHITVNASTTSVMLHDIAPNAEYSVEVAATTSVGTIGAYSSESPLTITGPTPPTNVSVTVTGCDSAEVNWTASMSMFEDIQNYSVKYQWRSGSGLNTASSQDTMIKLDGLTPNAEYNVTVAGINSCGSTSAFTTPFTFVLQDPAPPTGVLAMMGTECNTSNVSWSPSTVNYNAVIGNYSVRYRLKGTSDGYTTVYSPTTSDTLRGLDPSAEYDVEVAAVDLCGRVSGFSEVARLDLQVPRPPTGVTVEDGTECYTSVVSWTATQIMCGVVIGNYSVRYRLKNGGGNYTTMYTDGTSVTLGNITANAAYDVSVAAISSQIGQFTEALQFELQEPKPPTDVTFRVTGTNSIMVSWSASLSKCGVITNYSVTYQLTSGTGPATTVYTTETSITLQGLTNGEYNVMVSATNSMGVVSAISNATSFTVSTSTTPTGDDSTVIIIVAVIIVILVVVAVIAVAVILGVCCLRRKKKGKLYEPAVRASKPASSSTGQYDNMYAEVRETNGQPEKPPIEFDGGAASTADYDYAVVPKAGVFVPDGVAATEEAPGQPQSAPFAEHQYATVSKDGSLKPQGSSPRPLPKAHHKTPPPRPSPFSGKSGKVEKSAVNGGAFDAFLKQVESMHVQGKASFEAEYNSVDKSTAASTAMAELNNAKNRYKNIFPYDSSRVPLSVTNTSGTDYINASFVDGYKKKDQYIASQAPVPDTVDDFWQMIWDQKMNMVVMLTKTMEGTKRKSEDYYPESPGDTFSSGRFQIRTISLKYHVDYEVRVLEVAQTSNPSQTRTLDHYLFTGWPDYGVPKYPTSLIRMLYHVRDARVLDVPTLVHCSAGVGRSGTFIALDIILDQMNAEQKVDVKGTMQRMREKRMYMIQTVDQYTFVYDAVRELLMLGDTTIKASELRKAISQLKVSSGTGYQQQFASINTLTQESADDEKVEVDSAVIRYPERAPIKGKHLYISKPTVGGPVMQNASFVDGYHAHRAFIAAQSPLQSTVTDFWTLIAEKKVQTVLLLCPLVEDAQETCHAFWPHTEGGALDVGSMKVILLRSTATSDFDTLQFTIQKPRSTQDVTLLHYKQWPEKRRPKSASFLKLFTSAQKLQQPHSNTPILVACNDGLGRTGTFIAIWSLIEQMKAEGQIDVVSTVKSIRTQRPGAMPLMDQFVYCHDLLLEYVDSFEGYSNFSI